MDSKCVVIGIGNPYLQDDRAGVVIIEMLEKNGLPCRTEAIYTVGFEVIDKIRGCDRAIIVDACMLGNDPGSILEVTVEDIVSPRLSVNSHTLPLGTILKTGYICYPDEMPKEICIMLIEVKEIKEFTLQMSPEVEAAVVEVVARIKNRIATMA